MKYFIILFTYFIYWIINEIILFISKLIFQSFLPHLKDYASIDDI